MLTTDISLPVLGHILDIIGIYIGLYHWFVVLPVFCSQLAELVLSNTTGNNHPQKFACPNGKLVTATQSLRGEYVFLVSFRIESFMKILHLVPDVVALLWPLLPLGKIKPLWSSCSCVWSCVKWKPGTMWWLKGLSSPWREEYNTRAEDEISLDGRISKVSLLLGYNPLTLAFRNARGWGMDQYPGERDRADAGDPGCCLVAAETGWEIR